MEFTGLTALARRAFPWLAWLLVLVVAFFAVPASTAWADPATEAAAKALQKKAIDEDFLNMDYPAAIKKLQAAAAKCGGSGCSASVKGSILRDQGAMQILGGNEGDGRASFGQAVALDSTLDLDPSYKNPQLEGIWNDVKKKAPAGGGTPAVPTGPPPAGDFAHTPPAEALVRTPLPVYADYTGGETLARVIVKYKGPGMTDWKPLDLKKSGDTGWGALIPCKDVTSGVMAYYIQGFNAANDPVATSGSRNKPFSVPVKNTIAGEPPSLPGQEAPKQCSEMSVTECPPDFPGCNTKKGSGEDCDKNDQCKSNACVGGKCAEKKAGGEDCEKDDECTSDKCNDGKCGEAKKGDGEDCESGDECDSGECKEGKCGGGGAKHPRFFIGIQASIDLYLLPGAQDACLLSGYTYQSTAVPTQPGAGQSPLTSGNPYTCLTSSSTSLPGGFNYTSGAPFPGSGNNWQVNNAIQKSHSDQVQGGFAPGPVTLAVSFDYALNMNMLVGIRAGYELLTIPTGGAFAPFHGEARFTYLLGHDALTSKLAPMVFGGAGVGEFDAFVPVNTFLDNKTLCTSPPAAQGCNATTASGTATPTTNAWITAGPVFVTAGGGIRYQLAKKIFATGAVRLQGAFGGTAGFLFGGAPELGIQYGF